MSITREAGERRPVLKAVELQRLFATVVLINCPDAEVAKSLEAGGRRVVSIDHHRRCDGASWHGEASARTCLEQVEDILGRQWTPPEPKEPGEHVPTRAEVIAYARGGVSALARQTWRDGGGAEPPDRKAERRRNWRDQLYVDVEPVPDRQAEPAPEPPQDTAPAWADAYNRIQQSLWAVRDRDVALAHRGLRGDGGQPAAALRQRAVQGLREAKEILVRPFTTGRHAEGDPELVLALAPERYGPVLADAVVQWSAEERFVPPTRPFDILALVVNDEPSRPDPQQAVPLRLELHAGADRLPLIEELLKPESLGSLDADCVCGRERLTLRIAATDETDIDQQQALSRFADRLLDELLIGNRPLAAWRTSFLQPLRIEPRPYRAFAEALSKEKDSRHAPCGPCQGTWQAVPCDKEETGYITPALRPFVVPNDKQVPTKPEGARDEDWPYGALLSFERELSDLRLQVVRADRDEPLEHAIACVRVHLLANQVVLAEWTMEPQGGEPLHEEREEGHDNRRAWRSYLGVGQDPRAAAASLAEAVDWNASARFVYSSFQAREADPHEEHEHFRLIRLIENGQVLSWLNHARDVSPDKPGHGHFFRALLRAVLGQGLYDSLAAEPGQPAYTLLGDDRSRVVSSIVPCGGCPSTEAARAEVRALKARLHMVEPYGRKLPYDPVFGADELKAGSYDRFASFGTWYGVSNHSFVCLSYGRFGLKALHEHHMKTIYRRLFVLTLMQRAILHAYGLAIGRALQDWQPASGELPREYRELRPAFLRFTNVLWLREVSTQLQGVELFRLMQDRAELAAEHARVADEIEKTDGYWHDRREARRDQVIRMLTLWAAPITLFAGLWGWAGEAAPPLWCLFRNTVGTSDQSAALIGAGLLTVFAWFGLWLSGKPRPRYGLGVLLGLGVASLPILLLLAWYLFAWWTVSPALLCPPPAAEVADHLPYAQSVPGGPDVPDPRSKQSASP